MFFGVFMVFFYLGVAVLMAINYFGFPRYLSWFFAVAFAAYGIYRGYREVNGEHTYGMRRIDDDTDANQYTTYSEHPITNKDDNEKKD